MFIELESRDLSGIKTRLLAQEIRLQPRFEEDSPYTVKYRVLRLTS